ncbi:hypothetical protein ACU6TU_03120 [Halomonas sp. LS-001]
MFDVNEDKISEHNKELREVLQVIKNDVSRQCALKRFPTRYSKSILSHLKGNQVDNHSIGLSIRKIHDFYGWMAKEELKRGQCAGALYRTLGYLNIDRKNRDGTQGVGRNVHIEHTVPVRALLRSISFNLSNFKSESELHNFLIDRSVCVAFSHSEEKKLNVSGVHASDNEAFSRDGLQVHNYPFRRYLPLAEYAEKAGFEFEVYNVVSGKKVDLYNYSFQDHQKTLNIASSYVSSSFEPSVYSLDGFKFD